jgi:hypothetical protein
LAAVVLPHVEADARHAFVGDIAGQVPILVSTALWFTGRPGQLPDGEGPGVVEVFAVPSTTRFAQHMLKTCRDWESARLDDGAAMYSDVGAARGREPARTAAVVTVIVERPGVLVQVHYHGEAICVNGPAEDGRIDLGTLKAILSEDSGGVKVSERAL